MQKPCNSLFKHTEQGAASLTSRDTGSFRLSRGAVEGYHELKAHTGAGPNGFALHAAQISPLTLWASMRFMTRSRSPCTGWSSASCGSTLYNQSTKACRASMNWPENSRASSNLCCLRKAHKLHWFQRFFYEWLTILTTEQEYCLNFI